MKSRIECYNCYERGHISSECPKLRCYKCHGYGHFARDCRAEVGDRRGTGGTGGQENYRGTGCYNCGRYGHFAHECRDQGDRRGGGGGGGRDVCYNCGESGHFSRECTKSGGGRGGGGHSEPVSERYSLFKLVLVSKDRNKLEAKAEQLQSEGFGVDLLDDGEDCTEVGEHMSYSVSHFLGEAAKYSDQKPPDIAQFSEKIWAAAAFSLRKCMLELGVVFSAHNVRRPLLKLVAAGLSSSEDGFNLLDYYKDAEFAHSNFYEIRPKNKEYRKTLIEKMKKFDELIQSSDKEVVKEKLAEAVNVPPLGLYFVQFQKTVVLNGEPYEVNYKACSD